MALVGMLSDTHLPRGERRLPETCLDLLARVDLVVHAGDLTSASVLAALEALGRPVYAVHGNVDEPDLRAILPARRVVEVDGARIGVLHDAGSVAGREARLAAAFPGCAAVVYGHTHLPQVERHDGVWILNPGSPTERRRAPARSLLLVRVADGVVEPALVTLPG